MGPLVSLPLQGLARYLPLLGGGAAAASQTDPKGLEYLKESLSSLINPASYSLNPLEDILESKIIKFPEKNKGSEDNQTPNKDPDQDPKIPPSGIGEVLDLIKNKDENKTEKTTKTKISIFDEGYEGQLRKNLMSGLNKLGEDSTNIWFKSTQSPLYELEKMVNELPTYAKDKNEMEKLKVLKEKFVEEVGEIQEPIIKKKKRSFENDPIGLLVSDGSIDAAVDLIAGDEDMYFMYEEWYEDKLLNLQETLEDREGFDLYEDSLLKQQIQKLKDNYTTDEGIKDYILERDAETAEQYKDEIIYPDPKKPTKNPLEDILESQIQNKEKETYFGTEEAKESFYDASNNIGVMFDIKELNKPENQKYEYGQNIPAHEFYENQYHGGVGDLGNADAFKKLKKLSYYPEYKKLIQEAAKKHLGETFPAYRLVRGDMEAYRTGTPSLEKDINSYSLNPEDALSLHNMIDYSEGLGKNRNNLVLQEVYINVKDLVMRGKEAENEIVVNTKKLDTDTVRVFDPFTGEIIKDATKGQLVDKELFKFSDKTRLGGKKDELSNDDDFIKF